MRGSLGVLGLVLVAAISGGLAGGFVARSALEGRAAVQPIPAAAPSAPPQAAGTGLPDVIAGMRRSVTAIDVVILSSVGRRPVLQNGAGSGFVLSRDGLIATNAHVISGAQSIRVTVPGRSAMPATVVGVDADEDLAIIRIAASDLVPLEIGRSATLRVGDVVIAMGNALALAGGPTASMGIVSALERTITASEGTTYRHLIQTDAAINPGDSGGPLIDAAGRLVGINTIGSTSAENIGFAIAIDPAVVVLERLRAARS